MKKLITISFIITSLVLSGCTQAATQENDSNTSIPKTTQTTETNSSINYVDYSTPALQRALEKEGTVVLFFHAAWCPSCKAADKDFKENLGLLAKNNITILKADYDKELVLRKRYKVVLQHTFVQIDKNSKELRKWSGGSTQMLQEKIART